MKIYVLVDNTASGNFQAEHGLSYLIDHDEKILFDTAFGRGKGETVR
jgi:7,8-dihydropterin-6-yl-methyl-4-(beta-D-ribofuranosyl)aminobenzene 5'-phosphate synthase